MHQVMLKDCTKCHASAAGGKIEGFGKDWAHKTCKGCHSEMGKGPTSCKDCHKS
jgi:predicted CXXCH cytochrome family protein